MGLEPTNKEIYNFLLTAMDNYRDLEIIAVLDQDNNSIGAKMRKLTDKNYETTVKLMAMMKTFCKKEKEIDMCYYGKRLRIRESVGFKFAILSHGKTNEESMTLIADDVEYHLAAYLENE